MSLGDAGNLGNNFEGEKICDYKYYIGK